MLEGVSDVFKFFQASRLASAALLVTAACLIFGHQYFPVVPVVPVEWRWLIWAVMCFTGFQCAGWTLQALVRFTKNLLRASRRALFPVRLQKLSLAEQFVLTVATDNDGNFFPEHAQRYTPKPESIDISLAEQSLIRRGLMENGFMATTLTEEGKKFCLTNEISKRLRKNIN